MGMPPPEGWVGAADPILRPLRTGRGKKKRARGSPAGREVTGGGMPSQGGVATPK